MGHHSRTTTEATLEKYFQNAEHALIIGPNKMCTLICSYSMSLDFLLKFISSPVNICSLDLLQRP